MRGRQGRKRGFTLIETVVTVGIVAALAAVVYPQVVKQFDTADPTRAAEDLNSISTALATFGVNVRPNQPSDIEDLLNPISDTAAAVDVSARGTAYSAADVAAWAGPYLASSSAIDAAATAIVITTGFGGQVHNEFARYDVNSAATLATGGTIVTLGDIGLAEFLAVRIDGLSNAAFNSINELIDGTTENTDDLRRWGGRLRCPGAYAAGSACSSAYFMAAPIR